MRAFLLLLLSFGFLGQKAVADPCLDALRQLVNGDLPLSALPPDGIIETINLRAPNGSVPPANALGPQALLDPTYSVAPVEIGSGGFGRVFRGKMAGTRFIPDGEGSVVAKVFLQDHEGIEEIALIEVKNLKEIQNKLHDRPTRHQFPKIEGCEELRLVTLHDGTEGLQLTMTYIRGDNVSSVPYKTVVLDEWVAQFKFGEVGAQYADGLSDLHTIVGKVHGDIKGANLKYHKDDGGRFIDVGSLERIGSSMATFTPDFLPEHVLVTMAKDSRPAVAKEYNDVYALAVTLRDRFLNSSAETLKDTYKEVLTYQRDLPAFLLKSNKPNKTVSYLNRSPYEVMRELSTSTTPQNAPLRAFRKAALDNPVSDLHSRMISVTTYFPEFWPNAASYSKALKDLRAITTNPQLSIAQKKELFEDFFINALLGHTKSAEKAAPFADTLRHLISSPEVMDMILKPQGSLIPNLEQMQNLLTALNQGLVSAAEKQEMRPAVLKTWERIGELKEVFTKAQENRTLDKFQEDYAREALDRLSELDSRLLEALKKLTTS